MVITETSLSKRKRKQEKIIRYKKGDQVDIRDLLFSRERDFLVKNNPHQLVRAEQLEGKVIVLHFELLTTDSSCTWRNIAHLAEIYTELVSPCNTIGPFEVVFVAVNVGTDVMPKHFQEMFSSMPWTAIPFADSIARERLANSFIASESGGYYAPSSVVISKTGVILQHNALSLFQQCGVAGYPFSDERISCLISEDDEARERPSLKALLASPERDYVINNKGHKVNICDLEDKVVALYLYEKGCTNDLTESLRNAHKILVQEEKKKFEVVLIYIHDSWNTLGRTDAESFKKEFETMPWLALPFKDTSCKKVQRVFRYPFELGGPQPAPSLVIIGPFGEFSEPFGAADVLMNFGVEAYPFTRKKAYMLQVEKVMNVKLDMLWGPEAVFTRGCVSESTYQEVFFSDINVGKRVIVFCDAVRSVWYKEFKMMLRERYEEKKGKIDEFEVIHIAAREGEDVPWLRLHPDFPYEDSTASKILCDIFCNGYGILAFDLVGEVVRATSNPNFDREDCEFPFSDGHLEEEVAVDLIHRFVWDFWRSYPLIDLKRTN